MSEDNTDKGKVPFLDEVAQTVQRVRNDDVKRSERGKPPFVDEGSQFFEQPPD